ncbi:hypothetical protein D3C85_1766150 [compost metagenome]
MAQRDQVRGLLGALDGGQAGDADDVALLGIAALQQRKGGRQHGDVAGGHRHAAGFRLVADVDHVGLAGGIEMGKRIHLDHREWSLVER